MVAALRAAPARLLARQRCGAEGDNVVNSCLRGRAGAFWGRMPQRSLYLAAYDICDPKRLRKALAVMKQFATGGQKSVFECFLTEAEKERLVREMREVIAEKEDRFFLIPVEMRSPVHVLGIGVPPEDPPYYYAG